MSERARKMSAQPSRLSDAGLNVLAEAFHDANGGVVWIRAGDSYLTSSGNVSRTGRVLVAAGFLRVRPGAVSYLLNVPGAGKRSSDPPAQVMEITTDGTAALRRRMGENGMAQLERLRAEHRARLNRVVIP